jgi:hypothetical protein
VTGARAGLRRVWSADPFEADYQHGPGDQLVIAFSSVGHDPSRPPSPEFVRTLAGRRALFIRDAARSWANDPGFEAALKGAFDAACEAGPVARVMTLGLSMGAFSALVAAQVLAVDVVLAFGAQYSIAPGAGETRWAEWTDRLTLPRWPVAPLPAKGWVCLFHGGLDDRPQALAFPQRAGVDQVMFDAVGHSDLMAHLKAKGVLAGLIEAGLAGDRRRLLRISAGAGGVRRRFVQAWTKS